MTHQNTPSLARWVSPAARAWFADHVVGQTAPPGDIRLVRDHYDATNRTRLATALEAFSVNVARSVLGGVPVDIVTPTGGAVDGATLLCLHGGAFMWGAGAGALIEAVPIAAITRRTVIAVDYRLAPEHLFPAAVDDVLACYATLRETRRATSIGVYGCSAGGMLTAQMVARLILDGGAMPGAIAMLHATGLELDGDSLRLAATLNGLAAADIGTTLHALPFLAGTDAGDPLVFPGEHPAILAEFPPALLISGTRDFAASSIATMHRRLLSAGAVADLALFDGMWHAHHVDTQLPEARETFEIMARFFAQHLTTD
uniref:alpha/beta hydrolase n=1 Tax=uncultured Sphingomonas sp. TaxID=158754 RepID=UPI0035CA74F7